MRGSPARAARATSDSDSSSARGTDEGVLEGMADAVDVADVAPARRVDADPAVGAAGLVGDVDGERARALRAVHIVQLVVEERVAADVHAAARVERDRVELADEIGVVDD